MNGFGVDNKYMNGKSFQTLNSFKKEVKANGENVDKEKKEELMNKYQSRKTLEADTLSKQLKNDHSLSARNLHQYQNSINPIAPKVSAYDQARKLLVDTNQKQSKPVLGKGLRPGDVFDLNKKVNGTELAKRRAIEMMKSRKIEKQNPNKAYLSSSKKTKFELASIINAVETNLS